MLAAEDEQLLVKKNIKKLTHDRFTLVQTYKKTQHHIDTQRGLVSSKPKISKD